jgi:hypothetical protein
LTFAVHLKRFECAGVLLKYKAVFGPNDQKLTDEELQWYNEQKTRIETEKKQIALPVQPSAAPQTGNSQILELPPMK